MTDTLHLGVALDGAGWHPAAWRWPGARPQELFRSRYWVDLAREAEAGLLDLLTIEDAFAAQSSRRFGLDDRTDQVRGRLDAVLIASLVAPLTTGIGLVPTVGTTFTEPFHVASALSTLDHASKGRGGWRVKASVFSADGPLVGRRDLPELTTTDPDDPGFQALVAEHFDEAADVIEVVRSLWDSWEDDAIVRNVATGRFVDRDKLHYIDFEGRWFSVKGPSIVPRPPQGQPLVTALAHGTVPYQLAARGADLVFVTPHDAPAAAGLVAEVREAERAVGRTGEPLLVWADLVVALDSSATVARDRRSRLDELDGRAYRSDALIVESTADELADLLLDWRDAGIDGFRLRPLVLPHDLQAITRDLVPALQARDVFRRAYEAPTLRGLLGLPRPTSRYAAA